MKELNEKRGSKSKRNNFFPLTLENVKSFIGKKMYYTAGKYKGSFIINELNTIEKNPLKVKMMSGNSIEFAYIQKTGLESKDNGKTFQMTNKNHCFTLGDDYQELMVCIL